MENLIETFRLNSGFLKAKDIATRTQWRVLRKMLNNNSVLKIGRGLYWLNDNVLAEQDTEVAHIVPDGVLCLFSAWFYYGLSTTIPHSYYVAIEKKRKITLPDYPPILLCYWQYNQYELGISTYTRNGVTVKIYDIEKSVCDAIKFRNKVGMDVAAEVLKNYLKREDRNLIKLTEYAKNMRIYNLLKIYLEVEL